MKKRIWTILMSVCLLAGAAGCGGSDHTAVTAAADDSEGIHIVATIFPEYDWTRQVLGDRLEETDLTLLCNGVDLHSYQPSAEDMTRIADCDLFIYVGGESDEWVDDALASEGNPDRQVINLLDVLGSSAREEELVEGMQAEEEAEEEGEAEYDEHVWLSLRNAKQFTAEIARVLGELDPDHAAEYKGNADTYTASLDDLDSRYQEAVSGGRVSTLLFGDRFPFRYLTEDYGLDYYAAFAGCSAETEASFETIAFLTQKADELQLHTILKIEGEGNRIADTIAQNASYKDMKVSVLNSMQGISQKEIEEGKDYLSIMEDNLQVLTEALQ